MQAPTRSAAFPRRRVLAAAGALLAASVIVVNGLPRTASAASAAEVASYAPVATMHEGIDWTRVARTPVDTGATVGAYDR